MSERVSGWMYIAFMGALTILQSHSDWNKAQQAGWLHLGTRACMQVLVCMYWTRLLIVRPVTSIYRASPRKHHATGMQ